VRGVATAGEAPVTVEDVLNSRVIVYPFRLLQCCLVTDGGGALILVAADRARDFPQKPVYLLGTGGSVETSMVSQMADFTSSRAFRDAGAKAFAESGITHKDVDHLMIYDAPCSLPGASFAHLPVYGLEDPGFVPRGEAGAFIAERNTAPGGKLPLNTNGGGLSYMHSGRYGMYALQESVREVRGTNPAQVRRQDLGLPRYRRHVRRLWHDHHVKRAAEEVTMTARTDDYDEIVRFVQLYIDGFNDKDISKFKEVLTKTPGFSSSMLTAGCAST